MLLCLTKSNVRIQEIPEVNAKIDEIVIHLCSFSTDSDSGDGERNFRGRYTWDFH